MTNKSRLHWATLALCCAFPVFGAGTTETTGAAEIIVDVGRPVRVIVTASDGSHPDGSGRGVYADGRFYADGVFSVRVPPGKTTISISAGPEFEPQELVVEPNTGECLRLKVALKQWFSLRDHGWIGGDNHVHAQHDENADVRTDYAYAVLQARANGLRFITENGSAPTVRDGAKQLHPPDFLMMHAVEQRPGPFIGHFNTPGLRQPLEKFPDTPLLAQALLDAVHQRGGALIHTHPLSPRHQLHWMGATEMFSDAVLGQCADALDTDSPMTELFRFAVLNLGNRLAVSGSTDCDLGRRRTLSPGDRRVYCHADELSAAAIANALRNGRTFATDGGPLFVFFTVDGHLPGDVLRATNATARAEVHALRPLRAVEIYRRGHRVKAFDVKKPNDFTYPIHETERSWYTFRAEDVDGHWAVTSPIYFEPPDAGPRPSSVALLLEISNASRFAELRRSFFAHIIVTVSPDQRLTEVQLLKDGTPLRRFRSADGDRCSDKTPVTGIHGDYTAGSIWWKSQHLQADEPVAQSGWYAIRATTADGKTLASDAVYFDATHRNSHELSVVNMAGGDTRFTLWGYGEEAPLAEQPTGDHWWYPNNAFWQIRAAFGGTNRELSGGNRAALKLFRQAD